MTLASVSAVSRLLSESRPRAERPRELDVRRRFLAFSLVDERARRARSAPNSSAGASSTRARNSASASSQRRGGSRRCRAPRGSSATAARAASPSRARQSPVPASRSVRFAPALLEEVVGVAHATCHPLAERAQRDEARNRAQTESSTRTRRSSRAQLAPSGTGSASRVDRRAEAGTSRSVDERPAVEAELVATLSCRRSSSVAHDGNRDALVAQERLELAPARGRRLAGDRGSGSEARQQRRLAEPDYESTQRAPTPKHERRRARAPFGLGHAHPQARSALSGPRVRRMGSRRSGRPGEAPRPPPRSPKRTSSCRRTSPGRASGSNGTQPWPANHTSTQAWASWSVTTHSPVVEVAARESHCDPCRDPEHAEHDGHRARVVLAVARLRASHEGDERRPGDFGRRLVVPEAAALPEPRFSSASTAAYGRLASRGDAAQRSSYRAVYAANDVVRRI